MYSPTLYSSTNANGANLNNGYTSSNQQRQGRAQDYRQTQQSYLQYSTPNRVYISENARGNSIVLPGTGYYSSTENDALPPCCQI